MVRADQMEKKEAIYPRVIVDPEVFDFAARHGQPGHDPEDELEYVRGLIREDEDGRWFCDYVSWASVVESFGLEDEAYGDYLSRLSRLIERGLSHEEPAVAAKYLWLYRQYLSSVEAFARITPDADYWQQSEENCIGIAALPRFAELAERASERVEEWRNSRSGQ